MHRRSSRFLLVAVAGVVIPAAAFAQNTAKFYEDNCAVCHTIGGGDQAGPDLKGTLQRQDREWVIRLLFDPNGLAAGGDQPAIRFVKAWGGSSMPGTEGLTRQMAEELVAYIEKTAGTTSDATAVPKPDLTFTGDDRARGLAIFIGRQRLANSGPACVSCHAISGIDNVRGGRLGPDLTGAHARLGGASGTMAWLARPPTPLMRSLYRHKNLTEDETRAVTALLASDVPPDAPPGAPTTRWLLIAGIAGALLSIAVLGLGTRGRLRPVRRRLVEAAMHPHTARSIGPEGGAR